MARLLLLLESPSEDELLEERLPLELLLEELELVEGMEGMEAGDEDELLGIEGIEEEEEDEGDELGIEGMDEDEDDGDELGIDGMPLLLELCWVDSQPARTRASAEAPARVMARAEKWRRNGVFMVASV